MVNLFFMFWLCCCDSARNSNQYVWTILHVLRGAVFCIYRMVPTWLSSCLLKATRWERNPDCGLHCTKNLSFENSVVHIHRNECRHSLMPTNTDTHTDIPSISCVQSHQCVGAPEGAWQSTSYLTPIRPVVFLWACSPLTFYPWVRPLTGKWLLLYGHMSEVSNFHLLHNVFSGAQKVNSLSMAAEVNKLFLRDWGYVRLQSWFYTHEKWLYIQHSCTNVHAAPVLIVFSWQ